jgi:hypothetical protein
MGVPLIGTKMVADVIEQFPELRFAPSGMSCVVVHFVRNYKILSIINYTHE